MNNGPEAPGKTELQRNAEKALAMKQEADRLLFPSEVRAKVRLSEPTIYRLRRRGKFPEPIILGERRIAWRESVIDQWLSDRPHAA